MPMFKNIEYKKTMYYYTMIRFWFDLMIESVTRLPGPRLGFQNIAYIKSVTRKANYGG